MKKFAHYCSGGASRVIKFYEENSYDDFPFEFIFYDGSRSNVLEVLQKIGPNNTVLTLNNVNTDFKKSEISQLLSDTILFNLRKNNIDYLFCFGDRILKGTLINAYRNRIINFHPSLLPSFPGLKAIDQALNTSVQILGNSAHFIDDGVDTGPIIMQTVISRLNVKSYEDVLEMQLPMLKRIWELLSKEEISVNNNLVQFNCNVPKIKFTSI